MELKEYAAQLRKEAQNRLRADKERFFPHVPDEDFNAIVNAVGEITIIEARIALYKIEAEKNLR